MTLKSVSLALFPLWIPRPFLQLPAWCSIAILKLVCSKQDSLSSLPQTALLPLFLVSQVRTLPVSHLLIPHSSVSTSPMKFTWVSKFKILCPECHFHSVGRVHPFWFAAAVLNFQLILSAAFPTWMSNHRALMGWPCLPFQPHPSTSCILGSGHTKLFAAGPSIHPLVWHSQLQLRLSLPSPLPLRAMTPFLLHLERPHSSLMRHCRNWFIHTRP